MQAHSNNLKHILALFFVFLVLKSIAYFSPIFLSQITTPILYGEFEYSLNLGVVMLGVISFGLPSSYAYFIMKNNRYELLPLFHLHFIIFSFLLLITFVLFPALIGNSLFGALIIGTAMADQVLLANMLKANGKNVMSILVDTGVYLILGLLVVLGTTQVISFTKELWFLSILFSHLIVVLVVHIKGLKGLKQISATLFIELYSFGILVLITAPLVTLLTNSTRIYIEYFKNISEVGFYSFYFRIAAVLLLIYRVLSILLFRKLFLEDHIKLDGLFRVILSALGGVTILSIIVLQFPVLDFFNFTDKAYLAYYSLLPLMFFQVLFWINTAFFESVLIREKLVKQFIFLLIVILSLLLATLQLIDTYGELSLKLIVIINTWAIFGLFLGQQYILIRKKIYYKKSIRIHLLFGMLYAMYLVFV